MKSFSSLLEAVGFSKPKELPKRLLQVGLDFGTCWTKIVVRDYEAAKPTAFVVRPSGADQGPNNEFRIPSAVTLVGNELHFGWPAKRKAQEVKAVVYRSVKMRAAFPSSPDYKGLPTLPQGLSAEDLAILVVAYNLQVATEASIRYCGSLKPRSAPAPGVSMGAPMGLVADPELKDRFLTIIRVAFELVQFAPAFSSGLGISRGIDLIKKARERIASRPPVRDVRDWLRSEAEAGLLWIFQSPRVPPGRYACVDVGAGTTDVSFFRIVERFEEGAWQKGKLRFYSATSGLPGVDGIESAISEQGALSASGAGADIVSMIEKALPDSSATISAITKRMWEVYRGAWQIAYPKERVASRWKDFRLFVLGGGSKIPLVCEALCKTTWEGQLDDRTIVSSEYPNDLFEFEGRSTTQPFKNDAAFMLVAYGLSYVGADVPPVDAPEDGADYTPIFRPRRPIDQDEFYPK